MPVTSRASAQRDARGCQFEISEEEAAMNEPDANTGRPAGGGGPQERIPTLQKLLDNPFLLLFLGVVVPTVLYLVWGIMEIITIPIAR
jgi:hypothetical protein